PSSTRFSQRPEPPPNASEISLPRPGANKAGALQIERLVASEGIDRWGAVTAALLSYGEQTRLVRSGRDPDRRHG
ncbi:MAG: hypothetical protein MUQ27_06100, partial [Acidimicrobiia bacterium]|nr:hypothetical protein [Acidimicrobiia bacterium]